MATFNTGNAQVDSDLEALVGGEKDPVKRAALLEGHVLKICESGQLGDVFSATGAAYFDATWKGAYGFVATYGASGWAEPALRLITRLRERVLERQVVEKKRVGTAVLSQFLTETLVGRKRTSEGFRWALDTQAADILASHSTGGGLGRTWLYGFFGISEKEREVLDKTADQCRTDAGADWSSPAGFPEDVVRRLLSQRPAGSELFSRLLSPTEFPITRPYLAQLWASAMAAAPNTKTQGDRLEYVAEYLFSLLPGCVPMCKVKDIAVAGEHDLVIANYSTSPNLASDIFGRYFLVECKNWTKAARVAEIGYFLFRLRQAKSKFGVMFAREGITGKGDDEKHARALIARSFRGDDVTCIVISEADVKAMASGEQTSFLSLMRSRFEELRFGKPE